MRLSINRDEEILDYWFEKKDLSNASRDLYRHVMNKYSMFIGKPITELHDEADEEEEQGIRLTKRKYSNYIIKFKKYLTENTKI